MDSVTHLITTLERGGAEKQLLTLVREQCNSGRDVSVIPLKGNLELVEDFVEAGAQVNVKVCNRIPFLQLLILRKVFSKRRQIIHAHLPRAELFAALTKSHNKLVVSKHNAEAFFPKVNGWLSRRLARFVSKRADMIIAISEAVYVFIQENLEMAEGSQIKVIHYGRDSRLDSQMLRNPGALRDLMVREGGPIIGTIGRLVPQKDYPTLLKSFRLTLDHFPEATLLILGEGPERKNLDFELKKLGIADRVEFLGKKAEVENFLKSLDLFLLTSIYEGFGLVLLEAMSTCVPIVASSNSAIPEVLGLDHPGLSKTGDEKDFFKKISYLLTPEGKQMALDLQAKRLTLFSATLMASKIDQLYANL